MTPIRRTRRHKQTLWKHFKRQLCNHLKITVSWLKSWDFLALLFALILIEPGKMRRRLTLWRTKLAKTTLNSHITKIHKRLNIMILQHRQPASIKRVSSHVTLSQNINHIVQPLISSWLNLQFFKCKFLPSEKSSANGYEISSLIIIRIQLLSFPLHKFPIIKNQLGHYLLEKKKKKSYGS